MLSPRCHGGADVGTRVEQCFGSRSTSGTRREHERVEAFWRFGREVGAAVDEGRDRVGVVRRASPHQRGLASLVGQVGIGASDKQ